MKRASTVRIELQPAGASGLRWPRESLKPPPRVRGSVQPALANLTVPSPIGAAEEETGPATLAMAAATLDGREAAQLVERIEATRTAAALAHRALGLGYHVHLHTPEPDEVPDEARSAGLQVHEAADTVTVETALAARRPVIVSGPGDGPPFLLVLRQDDDELVVDDPSVEERTLAWTWDRLAELLETEPAPRLIEVGARIRADH
jgi:hypothetical protein